MSWEDLPAPQRNSGFGFMRMASDEVSIVTSRQNKKVVYRINIKKAVLPENTNSVIVRIDKEKKRIGFFNSSENPDIARRLCKYGTDTFYVTIPESITKIGFTKGRYKITKKDINGLYFMVSLKKKVANLPTIEELESKAIKVEETKIKKEIKDEDDD